MERAPAKRRHLAPRVHGPRRRARRLERRDLGHAGERRRGRRRDPQEAAACCGSASAAAAPPTASTSRSYNDSVMIDVDHGLFNGLVEWGQDGKPNPELAESLEPKNGAKDWIFNLRKGVTFSNGKEFAADDAIYSLNLHRGDTKSGGAAAVKPITDIKKLDKYQIQISLAAPDADLPYVAHRLSPHDGAGRVQGLGEAGRHRRVRAREIRSRRADLAQEGPRLLESRARAISTPSEVTVINDGSARLNALISGQIDAINRVDHKAVAMLSKTPKIQIVRAPGGWHSVLAMEIDKPPYDNPDIRMALKFADRPRADAQGAVQRLRHARQRSPDPADRSLFQQGTAAAQVRSREGGRPLQEGGHRRSEDHAAGVRRRLQRRGRRGRAVPGERGQGRHQGRPEEGARRRLLGQRLAQGRRSSAATGAAVPAATQMLSVAFGQRRAVERDALEQREVREAARGRARRDRRGQAQALHLGNAGDAATSTAARSSPCSRTGSTRTTRRSAATRRTAASTWTTAWIMEKAWIKA